MDRKTFKTAITFALGFIAGAVFILAFDPCGGEDEPEPKPEATS